MYWSSTLLLIFFSFFLLYFPVPDGDYFTVRCFLFICFHTREKTCYTFFLDLYLVYFTLNAMLTFFLWPQYIVTLTIFCCFYWTVFPVSETIPTFSGGHIYILFNKCECITIELSCNINITISITICFVSGTYCYVIIVLLSCLICL